MIKNWLISACTIVLITGALNAQQSAVLSQAIFNEILIDPAVAGSTEDIPLKLQFRKQWSGIDAAPVTQLASVHAPLGDQIGIGAYIYNDVAGPTRNTGFSIGLAYKLKLNDKMKLSFGLAGQLFQFSIDPSSLTTDQPGDFAIDDLAGSKLTPDASAGIMLKGEKYKVGISATNLFNSEQNLFDPSMPLFNVMERTFYLHAMYRAGSKEGFAYEPYLLTRMITQGLIQFDIGLRAIYHDKFFIGAGYRYESAALALAGLRFGQFDLSYSYDFGLSELQDHHSGSHEVLISYRFNKKNGNDTSGNRTPWFKRNQIYSPTEGQ